MSDLAQPRGWQHSIGLALEGTLVAPTWGTWAAPTQWLPGTSKIKRDDGRKRVDLAVGSKDRRHTTLRGVNVSGNVTYGVCPGRCDELAEMLQFVDADHLASFSLLARMSPTLAHAFWGLVAARATFRQEITEEGGGDLAAEIEYRGKDGSNDKGVGTPNFTSLASAFTGHELVVEANSTEMPEKRRVEIAFSHALKGDKWDNDRLLREIAVENREINIRLKVDLEKTEWRDWYLAGTVIPLAFTWTRGASDFGFSFPECEIMNGAEPEQVEKGSSTELELEIEVNEPDDGTAIGAVIVDGVSTDL